MNKGNMKTSSLIILFETAIKTQKQNEKGSFLESPKLLNWIDCLSELKKGNTINIIKD